MHKREVDGLEIDVLSYFVAPISQRLHNHEGKSRKHMVFQPHSNYNRPTSTSTSTLLAIVGAEGPRSQGVSNDNELSSSERDYQ